GPEEEPRGVPFWHHHDPVEAGEQAPDFRAQTLESSVLNRRPHRPLPCTRSNVVACAASARTAVESCARAAGPGSNATRKQRQAQAERAAIEDPPADGERGPECRTDSPTSFQERRLPERGLRPTRPPIPPVRPFAVEPGGPRADIHRVPTRETAPPSRGARRTACTPQPARGVGAFLLPSPFRSASSRLPPSPRLRAPA